MSDDGRASPSAASFEDIAVGDVWRFGPYTVTAEEIIAFGRAYDPQPYHTDPEAAKTSIFGELVASGAHSFAILIRMLYDGALSQGGALASPGADAVRWRRPVRPGDTLSGTAVATEKIPSRSKPDRGLVKFRHTVVNQHGETVMTMDGMAFFRRR